MRLLRRGKHRDLGPAEEKHNWTLTIYAYEMSGREADRYFDRIASVAHEDDHDVSCAMVRGFAFDDEQDWA